MKGKASMKKLLFALLVALTAATLPVAVCQNLSTSGSITVQAAACLTGSGSGYVYYLLPSNASSVAVALSGTWSGTVQFVGSVDGNAWGTLSATPIAGGSAVTSATANGIWSLAMAGLKYVCAYASTYSSGTVAVAMSTTTGVAASSSASPVVLGSPINLSGQTAAVGATSYYTNNSGLTQLIRATVGLLVTAGGTGTSLNPFVGATGTGDVANGNLVNPAAGNGNSGNTSSTSFVFIVPNGQSVFYGVTFTGISVNPTYQLYAIAEKIQ